MIQRTKIVATLGPASESTEVINSLLSSGVTVFRFNLKHNNYDWHKELMDRVRKLASEKSINVTLFSDLQGPELRTGVFPNGQEKLTLKQNEEVIFGKIDAASNLSVIPFNDLSVIQDLEPGNDILIDDGKIEIEVIDIYKDHVTASVKGGGELGNTKSISIPQATIAVPTLHKKDLEDVKFSVSAGVDYIALSFVRDATDIATLRQVIEQHKGTQGIIAKIETLKSLQNLDDIIDTSDAIMVARGDLGVEVPIERVPKIQKQIITKCREQSKPVIVATQMLLSMVRNPIPSRAEVADIANSVFDKTDALMLSEESATGDHPIRSVSAMAKIARYNESLEADFNIDHKPKSYEEIIIEASINFTRLKPPEEEGIKGYIVFTESGKSARVLSRFRSPLPVFAFSKHHTTVNKLSLTYGVRSFHLNLTVDPIQNTRDALDILTKDGSLHSGDKVIVIFGNNVGVPEANNTLSIIEV